MVMYSTIQFDCEIDENRLSTYLLLQKQETVISWLKIWKPLYGSYIDYTDFLWLFEVMITYYIWIVTFQHSGNSAVISTKIVTQSHDCDTKILNNII